ncbi:MAG: hypothetical protein JST90_17310 [Bacteroidetes bacterium]|nr:hypothetical protein [Bacteroidota bacterium]
MIKNVYYRNVLRRNSFLESQAKALQSWAVSYPRLLLEVFIRKNFGERYFSMGQAALMFLFLFIFPMFYTYGEYSIYHSVPIGILWGRYTTWYAFIFAFYYFAIQRQKEIKVNPSVYDFAKFSLYGGEVNSLFSEFGKKDGKIDWRKVETLYEPAPFLAAGIVLWLIGQPLGILLTVSALLYTAGYNLAYLEGDHFVMDRIDERLMNAELTEIFVNDVEPKDAKYVNFRGRKPNDPELRKKVAETFQEEDSATVI